MASTETVTTGPGPHIKSGTRSRSEPQSSKRRNLSDPALYNNQELGRLDFLARVLAQVSDERHPLLEKVRFLAIFGDALDEFFSIRVSGLKEQIESGLLQTGSDGLTPQQQLTAIRECVQTLQRSAGQALHERLLPTLAECGIRIVDRDRVKPKSHALLDEYFEAEVFPVLTPLAVDPGHPFPHISNLSLNLAVVLKDDKNQEHFARVKVPDVLPRLIPLGGLKVVGKTQAKVASTVAGTFTFVWLDQLIAANLNSLFPGMDVVGSYPFRVIRDADLDIQADEADDLASTVEMGLRQRRFGEAVQLVVEAGMPERVLTLLTSNLDLSPEDVYESPGPLGLGDLMELTAVDRPDLKDPPLVPRIPLELRSGEDVFEVVKQHDLLLHHPYESFATVVDLLQTAARDPQVLAIKQTLYRIGPHAPVVNALLDAAQHGKQVAVLVELTARGDERYNIDWARELERAGVHVAYGLVGLKTHAKVALIVRREADGIRRYVHFGTGNYNASTARTYEDYALLTAREDLATDASELFNYLTGYSARRVYRSLLVAPLGLRSHIVERLEREIQNQKRGRGGHVIIKVNALTDDAMARELYRASQEGVKIQLIVRGSCVIRPAIRGASESITVRSLVGRFLEHSRVYAFRNNGDWEVFMGSADLMPRNLERRVEVLFRIRGKDLISEVRRHLDLALTDNVNSWDLEADGNWRRISAAAGRQVDSQNSLIGDSR